MADPARRAAADVPEGLTFQTRPQQVREMIESARQAGVPFAWFTTDEEFGQNPGLRDYLVGDRIPYLMAIPKNTISTDHLGGEAAIGQRATQLAPNDWQRRACGIGLKGFRVYDWAFLASDNPDNPTEEPAEPETAPPVHRQLIALTLAEIRRLLDLIHRAEHAITHGLHRSTWRRHHQTQARRAHARRRLRLQTLRSSPVVLARRAPRHAGRGDARPALADRHGDCQAARPPSRSPARGLGRHEPWAELAVEPGPRSATAGGKTRTARSARRPIH